MFIKNKFKMLLWLEVIIFAIGGIGIIIYTQSASGKLPADTAIYIFGGDKPNSPSIYPKAGWIMIPKGQWRACPPVVDLNGKIYVIGGEPTQPLATR